MISSQKYKQTEKLQNSFIPSPRNEQVFVNWDKDFKKNQAPILSTKKMIEEKSFTRHFLVIEICTYNPSKKITNYKRQRIHTKGLINAKNVGKPITYKIFTPDYNLT